MTIQDELEEARLPIDNLEDMEDLLEGTGITIIRDTTNKIL